MSPLKMALLALAAGARAVAGLRPGVPRVVATTLRSPTSPRATSRHASVAVNTAPRLANISDSTRAWLQDETRLGFSDAEVLEVMAELPNVAEGEAVKDAGALEKRCVRLGRLVPLTPEVVAKAVGLSNADFDAFHAYCAQIAVAKKEPSRRAAAEAPPPQFESVK
eukprot:CAMPEP_0119267890 /NCGR_PEP_ID=MMETSP1329-20130426/5862_1 /TAXON_ID=114041 /ORGANISM="Genus nov. species nov., Strain RCC1024" /LENGTH=165 /DNA_ID=CAMNT_0007267831 /DNA_START=63 /DNA_END=561 /DNA_ORIENTATION=-